MPDDILDLPTAEKAAIFSKTGIVILLSIIVAGVILSVFDMPGLPLSIPGTGCLIGHLTYRLFTRPAGLQLRIISTSAILFVLLLLIGLIEIFHYLGYNALLVLLGFSIVWITTEHVSWLASKK